MLDLRSLSGVHVKILLAIRHQWQPTAVDWHWPEMVGWCGALFRRVCMTATDTKKIKCRYNAGSDLRGSDRFSIDYFAASGSAHNLH
jgi:hypothetical protein